MKRTPLQRKTPLRRKTRLRAKGKGSYARRPRDTAYMLRVKRLPCMVRVWIAILQKVEVGWETMPWPANVPRPFILPPVMTPCCGVVQADHMGDHAGFRKGPDNQCVPMCEQHHRDRTDYTGPFKGWRGFEMKEWRNWAVRRTQIELCLVEGM